jgi:hypothetical protein
MRLAISLRPWTSSTLSAITRDRRVAGRHPAAEDGRDYLHASRAAELFLVRHVDHTAPEVGSTVRWARIQVLLGFLWASTCSRQGTLTAQGRSRARHVRVHPSRHRSAPPAGKEEALAGFRIHGGCAVIPGRRGSPSGRPAAGLDCPGGRGGPVNKWRHIAKRADTVDDPGFSDIDVPNRTKQTRGVPEFSRPCEAALGPSGVPHARLMR